MVDQRAVTAAMKALGRKSKTLREGMTAAIEAYEAARPDPNPWQPIQECEHDTGNWFLVHKDYRMRGSFDLMFWDETHEWCVVGGDRTYTNDDLIGRRAMFRTIDPPTQNTAQEAEEAHQQPIGDQSGAS